MEGYKKPFPVLDRMLEVMDAKGRKIRAVAEMSEIPEDTIRAWYKRGNYPPVDKLERICDCLDISLAEFFNNDPDHYIAEGEDAAFLEKWHMLRSEDRELTARFMDELLKKQNDR